MKYLAIFLIVGLCLAWGPAAVCGAAEPETEELTPERRAAMEDELARIRAEVEARGHTWIVGETSRMRMTPEQRQATLMPLGMEDPAGGDRGDAYLPGGFDRDRSVLDWRDNGGDFVTDIRDQGGCGSCWSFASTAIMESAYLIALGAGDVPFFDLSEQQVLNCINDYYPYSDDCDGGFAYHVYRFGVDYGMVEESCAPYLGSDTQPCVDGCDDAASQTYFFNNYGQVCYNESISLMKDALHNHGPLQCSMDVYDSFEAYGGGIYVASGTVTGRHAVTIIGYNDDDQYWICKNSWGEDWGMNGWFHMAYNAGCDFGSNTYWADYVIGDSGPHAAMAISELVPMTCDSIWFEDRSVALSGEIVSWEWDFEGDGVIDATGPGPHLHIYEFAGTYSPWLRVEDIDGQVDIEDMRDFLWVGFGGSCWDGPVWHVDTVNGLPDGNGSPVRPFETIQVAINVAVEGDTVFIHPGTYTGIGNRALNTYGDDIVITAADPAGVILDGQGAHRLFVFADGQTNACRVENLTLRRGYDDEKGGAVLIEGAAPVFAGCVIDSSAVGASVPIGGGGVWVDGSAGFHGCTLSGCAAPQGGGAIHHVGGDLTVDYSIFTGNEGVRGGAIASTGGSLVVADCEFTGNLAAEAGSAVSGDAAALTVSRSRFLNNTVDAASSLGGCVAAQNGSTLDMNDVLLTGNTSPFGGAIYLNAGTFGIAHATIQGNTATMVGGAIGALSSTGEVCNSILWGNISDSYPEVLAPSGMTMHHTLIAGGWTGEGNIDEDPLFLDAPGGDFGLPAESPAVSAGSVACATTPDIDGQARPRPDGTQPDLGAFESDFPGEVGIDDAAPAGLRYVTAYPNPFNPQVTISFATDRDGQVALRVFDCSGRRVAEVANRVFAAGAHSLTWRARNDAGDDLATGVYLLRVETAGYAEQRKLVLIR